MKHALAFIRSDAGAVALIVCVFVACVLCPGCGESDAVIAARAHVANSPEMEGVTASEWSKAAPFTGGNRAHCWCKDDTRMDVVFTSIQALESRVAALEGAREPERTDARK